MRLITVLVVLALFAFMGCKEKAAEQKTAVDTTKVVAPVAQPAVDTAKVVAPVVKSAPAVKPADTSKKNKK